VIADFGGDLVAVTVSADGYETGRKTLEVRSGFTNVPPISLKRSPTLELSSTVRLSKVNGRETIRSILHNKHTKKPNDVRSVRIVGTASMGATCMGGSEGTRIVLADQLVRKGANKFTGSVASNPDRFPLEEFHTEVSVENYGQCGISPVHIEFPWLIGLQANERSQLEVEVPAQLEVVKNQQPRRFSWRAIRLEVKTTGDIWVASEVP
jgi:hypothetical protein